MRSSFWCDFKNGIKFLSAGFIFMLLFYIVPSKAQILDPGPRLSCSIDFSRFQYSEHEGYVEFYYAVYPSSVTFKKGNDTLQGAVVFSLELKNIKNDSLVVKSSFSLSIATVDTTPNFMNNAYLGITKHIIPNGIYDLNIYAYDALKPSRKDSLHKQISLTGFGNAESISDLTLCSNIEKSQDTLNPFYKNSFKTMVNPGLLFGSNTKPVVFTYAEFYNLKIDSFYSVTAQIVDAQNRSQKKQTRIKKYSVGNAVDAAKLNVFSIPSGKYKLQLILADTLGREFSRAEKPIYIYNPQLKQTVAAKTSEKIVELAGLSDDELIDEFSKARYIAKSGDARTFDKLTTAEAHREFLANFWVNVENDQNGTSNLSRKIYLDRISTANDRYRSMGKEGWKTDRGRVFIIYGEPDEIERVPSSDIVKPYEIWDYHQIEGGAKFVFIDRFGYGEYQLVHSTKRGELQDESWQQYLQ
jgi:GWxTD domain-containing protein